MTASVDTNILVYASNRGDVAYLTATTLMERLSDGPEILYLFWPVLMGYIRVVTHPSILPRPLSPDEAMTNVDRLLLRPHVRAPGESSGFWRTYRDLGTRGARSNAVPDTHLAALMRENGVRTLYTRDRGFRRFDFLDVRDPFVHQIHEGPA